MISVPALIPTLLLVLGFSGENAFASEQSVCSWDMATKFPRNKCAFVGEIITSPTNTFSAAYTQLCRNTCLASSDCETFGFDSKSLQCFIYNAPITQLQRKANRKSTITYSQRPCWVPASYFTTYPIKGRAGNGGFEAQGGSFKDWNIDNTADSETTIGPGYKSKSAANMSAAPTQATLGQNRKMQLATTLSVCPSATYNVSFFAKRVAPLHGPTGNYFQAYSENYMPNNPSDLSTFVTIETNSNHSRDSYGHEPGKWYKYNYSFMANNILYYMFFDIYYTADNTPVEYLIDDIVVYGHF